MDLFLLSIFLDWLHVFIFFILSLFRTLPDPLIFSVSFWNGFDFT